MSKHSKFEERVGEYICNHLVSGIKDIKIQECLQNERALTLEQAIEIAVSIESAWKYSKLMQEALVDYENPIHKFPLKQECKQYRNNLYTGHKCTFKNSECYKCHKIGHTHRKCRQQQVRFSKTTSKGMDSYW